MGKRPRHDVPEPLVPADGIPPGSRLPRAARLAVAAALMLTVTAAVDAAPPNGKLRILVDKVLMAGGDQVMAETHVREIAAAGFNVVSPRWGNDDVTQVRRVAEMAQSHGMRHMPWLRGTLVAADADEDDHAPDHGNRMVWADGGEQILYSPNADELWDWLADRILGYARISAEVPSLMGVFLDFENYAPRAQADAYGLSYDAQILGAFGRAYAIAIPELTPDQRRPWLQESGRHDAFEAFQVEMWQRRCRQLRMAVDEINPRFQFCVAPAPGTPFIERAVWREWATDEAPLILADGKTYGRPSELLPHAEALEANRRRVLERRDRLPEDVGPIQYIGGINPIVKGADPEYSGKNGVMLADAVDGYWVFYEGVTSDEAHGDYFHWFTWANEAIAAGRMEARLEPRQTPEPWAVAPLRKRTARPQLAVYGAQPRILEMLADEGTFEVHELRGTSAEYLAELDVVVLQNFNVPLDYSDGRVQILRQYVEGGGGLMIAHDTGWYMASPVPEVAVRDYPTQKVESVRHVVETTLKVVSAHPALGSLAMDDRFHPRPHDLSPRPSGTRSRGQRIRRSRVRGGRARIGADGLHRLVLRLQPVATGSRARGLPQLREVAGGAVRHHTSSAWPALALPGA
ncbi:hypothetical protein ACFL6X_09355 [Candidatus Latescibacterota bacterium]